MPLQLLLQVALFGFLAICTSSCQSSHSNNEILAEVTDGFHSNNIKLAASNENIFLSLKMKKDDPRTEEKIAIWLPKAEHIKAISSQIVNYLDSLQTLFADTIKKRSTISSRKFCPERRWKRNLPSA